MVLITDEDIQKVDNIWHIVMEGKDSIYSDYQICGGGGSNHRLVLQQFMSVFDEEFRFLFPRNRMDNDVERLNSYVESNIIGECANVKLGENRPFGVQCVDFFYDRSGFIFFTLKRF